MYFRKDIYFLTDTRKKQQRGMLCCYATSVHQTFTKKMICVVPENNKIISIQPLPPLMEGIGNSRGWGEWLEFFI